MGRHVDTPYGPMAGCPDCGVIVLSGPPHVCEHGVTPPPAFEMEFALEIKPAGERKDTT